MEQKKGKRKTIVILVVTIAIISFFTLPSVKSYQKEKKILDDMKYTKIHLELSEDVYAVEYYSAMGKKTHSSKESSNIEISNYKEFYYEGSGKYIKQLTEVWMTTVEKNDYKLNIGTTIIETPGVEKIQDFSKLENPNININNIVEQMGLEGDYVLVTSSEGVPIALYESDSYNCDSSDNLNLQTIKLDSDDDKIVHVQNGGVYKISSK